MRVALDTNVLIYAEGLNGPARQAQTQEMFQRLPQQGLTIPVQVLGELFNVLVRKARLPRSQARDMVRVWQVSFVLQETSTAVMAAAHDLAADHQFSIWDAVVLSAASRAGCRLLLSEDLQDGFNWGGVTVANPYAEQRHPLLQALIDTAS